MKENTLLQAFTYGEKPVRTNIVDDEPWFCLADVGAILEMERPTNFTRSEWCDPRGVMKFITPTSSGEQEILFINERNLYAMVARSSKPEAKRFMDWVYSEVLPQIRKTGSYSISPQPAAPSNELLVEMMKSMISLTGSVTSLIDKLDVQRGTGDHAIAGIGNPAVYRLKVVEPVAGDEIESPTAFGMRKKVMDLIGRYARITGIDYQDAYHRLYDEYSRLRGINLELETVRARMGSKIAYIDSINDLPILRNLAERMIRQVA